MINVEINENESEIGDLEIRIVELEDELGEKLNSLEREMYRLKESLYSWRKLNSLSIPYTYEKLFLNINHYLLKTWFPIFLKEYKSSYSPKRDRPSSIDQKKLHDKNWLRDLIFENVTYLKNAKVFHELGSNVSVDIKPILLYYSSTYLYSFFINSLIFYENKRDHHGIKISVEEKDINRIRIRLLEDGFFPRLVKTLSFLHYSSIFSDFIIDFEKKGSEIEKPVFYQNRNEFIIGNGDGFLLQQLLDADSAVCQYELNKFRLKHSVLDMQSKFINTSELLKNYILLFVACSLARYNPLVWRKIYEGEKTDFFIRIQPSFEDVNSMIDLVLAEFSRLKERKYPRFQQIFSNF